ncbi:maleylpyruvate isomerase family mycothiol-dependent enzyme [Nocardia fluminea]|uniref:maleylpyruvate isomerase family mycothiol-dependent enzyme n=1 Tax=Nocardia fluminea TaxID=134984 RepID=UPI0034167BD2
MTDSGVAAVQRERAELLRLCRDLNSDEWHRPSLAEGWRIQDVVAHLGSGCHAMFSPALISMLRSTDIERTNDVFVDRRREWSPARVLGEYERWSGRVTVLAGLIAARGVGRVRVPAGELGRFPLGQVLTGALVFDVHTHLRHDIAPALGRTVPGTDPERMTLVLAWMFAVLTNQLRVTPPVGLTGPIDIELDGPGGGTWSVHPDGTVLGRPAAASVAVVSASTLEFPEWATRRARWQDRQVSVVGDRDVAARFLDALNIV